MSTHAQGHEFDPTCPECAQEAATAGFNSGSGAASVSVPVENRAFIDAAPPEVSQIANAIGFALASRGVAFTADDAIAAAYRVVEQTPAVRVTEAVEVDDPKKPYGDVEYADPGLQEDGKKRYPLDTRDHVKAAWSYINQAKNAAQYSAADLKKVKAKIKAAAKKFGIEISDDSGSTEAYVNGSMSFGDIRTAVAAAIQQRLAQAGQSSMVSVCDLTDSDVVYEHGDYEVVGDNPDLFQCSYEIDDAGTVTLGEPVEVVRTYTPAPEPPGDDGDDDDVLTGDYTAEEAFDAAKHPRAPAGSSAGGQFAPLSYDSGAKTGTGYGKKHGDPHVRQLQEALNRLHMTDGNGHELQVDGKLGPLTTAAVKKAQRALGVKADGKVTPDLLKRLRSAKSLKQKTAPAKKSAPTKKAAPMKKTSTSGGAKSAKPMATATIEAEDRIIGRVLEAKGEDEAGNRIFGVRIIAYGDSKNHRRYPEAVMRQAAPLYEGAKAYDHHRTDEELQTSTINGLIGSYRNVQATSGGLEADLHLLPGATHAAEALDATIAAQQEGLPPLVGLSHDVMAKFRPVVEGGKRLQEATAITKVHSADLVADPAAGGQATRAVAGGIDGTGTEPAEEEEGTVPTKEEILAAFKEASDEDLKAVGLARASETTETDTEPGNEPEAAVEATEEASVTEAAGEPKGSFLAALMIREKVKAAGLPEAAVEGVTAALPDRITEAVVDNQLAAIKASMGIAERAGLMPQHASGKVVQEALDKKKAALDNFFAGNFQEGYYSFRQAFEDFTGRRPRNITEDYNRVVLRESLGGYDSAMRSSESMDSTTWNLVLGDSITRRMVAEYQQPSLQTWRQVVSSTVPVNDFRTQRIDRIGGYGTLPTVNQGAPYQPLTSPANEEVTYAITKKGGTEDLTLEMIANDDVRAISRIPAKLGLAASQTLYRFVWDFLRTNPNIYDGNALFTNGAPHSNQGTSALSQSALSAARASMRGQTAFGDTSDVLSIVPKYLVVPSALEEIAFQLTRSAVAVPATPAGPSDTPNIHAGSEYIVVDYFSDANDWFLVADPMQCPTIEVGFYQGREIPELFTQNDQSVGSMFDADKLTYKIRHIYSGAVLDYRGLFNGHL